jgi:hypothetical protein
MHHLAVSAGATAVRRRIGFDKPFAANVRTGRVWVPQRHVRHEALPRFVRRVEAAAASIGQLTKLFAALELSRKIP